MGSQRPEEKRDPDPLVMQILVNLTSNALASAIVKAARRLTPRSELADDGIFGELSRRHEIVTGLADQMAALIPKGTRRLLGGQLMLDRESINHYHAIRDDLLKQVVELDRLSEDAPAVPGLNAKSRARLPMAFKTQVRLLEKRLRSANTASNAEEHILEIRAALDAMRRILDSAE